MPHGIEPPLAAPGRSTRVALLAAVRGNLVLFTNTMAVSTGAALTAVAGFAYWWIAARAFDPVEVGTASALISVMSLIGLVGDFGLGTLLLGSSLRDRPGQGLVSAAVCACLAIAAGLALGWLLLGEAVPVLNTGLGGWGTNDALFVIGCALQAMTLVIDHALISQLQGPLQLLRNVSCSVLKLALLQALAMALPEVDGTRLLLVSWVVGFLLAMGIVIVIAARRGVLVPRVPDFGALLPQMGRVVDHHLLNMAALAPSVLVPFLIAVIFSPAVTAAFYPAWAMVHAASLFTAALTTVLYRIGSADPQRLRERMGISLLVGLGFCAAMAGVFFAIGRPILAFFNPVYPDLAGDGFVLLGFGLIAMCIRQHYIVVVRVEGRMRASSGVFALWSALEIGCACVCGAYFGVAGFVLGWLVSITVQAATMLPTLLRACGLGPRRWAAS